MVNIRRVNSDDFSQLPKLWANIFYDDEFFLTAFFSTLTPVMEAFAAEEDGQLVGSAFVLDIFTYKNGDAALPCPYIYAVGVLPEFRGKGIGKELTLACRDFCCDKYGVSCLVPANSELFDYYRRFADFVPAIYVDECMIEREGAVKAEITPITYEKYGELREQLLAGQPHMEYNTPALNFLEKLCELQGGGLYILHAGNDYAIAAVENMDSLYIKELLCTNGNARGFAAALLWHMDCERLYYRTPINKEHPENAKALGMLSKSIFDGPIYLGPAFD